MKIRSAITASNILFRPIDPAVRPATLVVEAGAEVSAVALDTGRYHLNYRCPDGNYWDATVGPLQLNLGVVIATVNEG